VALVGRVETDGSWTEVGRSSGFGHWPIVASDGDHVLFYQGGLPYGYVGVFDTKTGQYKNTEYRHDFLNSWTMVTTTHGVAPLLLTGRGRYFVFYGSDGTIAIADCTGAGAFRTLGHGAMMSGADYVVPAGQLGVFAYDSRTGRGQFGEIVMGNPPTYRVIQDWPLPGQSGSYFEQKFFVSAAKNGLVFFYRPDTGVAVAGGFSRGGGFQQLNRWDATGFRARWSHIAGIDSSPALNPLFYPR
jgi:hypothetical protein